MRCAVPILLLLCACLRAQNAVPVQQSDIQGIAIDAITRQPMVGVHVTMRAVAAHEDANAYGAISRPDGRFSITDIKPDLYVLDAQHNGYVYLPPKAPNGRDDPTIAIKTGEQINIFVVQMTPHAVIVGHVLDENGDPVPYVEVTTIPAEPARAAGSYGSAQTDDRGQFRFALPPGKFYIQANANRGPAFGQAAYGPPEIRSDGLGQAIYGTVFYPGTASKDKATPVDLVAGQNLTGVDIRLARRRSLTISGVVTGIPQTPAAAAFIRIMLFSLEDSDRFRLKRESQAAADGRFTIPGLVPGRYRVLAMADSGTLRSAAAEVQPENGDVTGVTLPVVRGATLPGTLEIEGGPVNAAPAEKLTLRLQSEPGIFDQSETAETGTKGAFQFEQVFPGRFRILVVPMPENAYVKSVKLGGREAPDALLDLSRGVTGASVSITLNRNGGRVEGAVLGEDGKPARSSAALVILAAQAEDISQRDIGQPVFKRVEAGVRFAYRGLRPGKYRLFAIDAQEFSGDLERVKALFPNAPEIEIHEGDQIARDVKVTAMENTVAKP